MKKLSLIWLILTDKIFFDGLKAIILYAFRVNDVVGGKDATDINHTYHYYCHRILNNKSFDEFSTEPKFKIPPSSLIKILEKYTDEELDELKKDY